MARIAGVSPAKMSGLVGDYTYRQTKYGTIVSEKIQRTTNTKRTLRQMMTRIKLANLASFYKTFNGALSRGFENLPKGWNAMNAFISANSQRSRVYLTKDMVQNNASVVDSYQITRGSLRTIEVEATGNSFRSSLSLGGLVITAQTTVAELADALRNNNMEVHYGDQISYFAIRQITDANGFLRAVVYRNEITLDPFSTARVWDLADSEGFQTNGGYLGQPSTGTLHAGGFAWVLSREMNGNLQVSTQFIQSTNSEVVAELSTDIALERAIASYGGLTDEVFLQPNMDEWGTNEGQHARQSQS